MRGSLLAGVLAWWPLVSPEVGALYGLVVAFLSLVESWLRHHGKRSVKRFDAYTYLLYTRAMDLHDVGHERGSRVSALDRVRCDVLVVGISSDELYSAADVRLGADMLEHLGRSVAYEEIRSPHGHDGFLLETDQLSAALIGACVAALALVGGLYLSSYVW